VPHALVCARKTIATPIRRYTTLHKVLLGRRALHGRARRRTRSPLGPSNEYRYHTTSYNRSPNISAAFRHWQARAHQHEERLRRRRTPPCKHDGARAVEAQRARRAAYPHHRSTHGHCIDARRARLPQEEPLAAARELCASRRRAAPAWRMAGDVDLFTPRSALGAARSQPPFASRFEFFDRVLTGAML
jgi:hypothetical protein